MIKYTNVRGGDLSLVVSRDQSVGAALCSLLQYELGYGGRVVGVSETKVVVETRILRAVDVVTFEGPESEVLYLLKGFQAYYTLRELTFDEGVNRTLESTKGVPLFVTAFGGGMSEVFTGMPLSIVAGGVAAGFDEEGIRRLVGMKKESKYGVWEDAWTVIGWALESSPSEALAVAG